MTDAADRAFASAARQRRREVERAVREVQADVRGTRPWDADDSDCPFLTVGTATGVWDRTTDRRYKQHNICCYRACGAWIKNTARTCKEHKRWYDRTIRHPARRLIKLLRQAQQRGDLETCPAIVLGADGYGQIARELTEALRDR